MSSDYVNTVDEPTSTVTATATETETATAATTVSESATATATATASASATATATTGFKYEVGINDLTDYALDFVDNEELYYNTIRSYTNEKKVTLFICVNGLISASGYYDPVSGIEEFYRINPTQNKFSSIREWYNDFYGEAASINNLLNNVFIGEDLVPLWKVLVVASEEDVGDNLEVEVEEEDDTQYYIQISPSSLMVIYLLIILNLSLLLGTLIVSLV